MHKVVICGLDTSKLPKITAKECDELLLKVRNGDSDAKETLVMSNLRLVLSVVQRFSGKGNSLPGGIEGVGRKWRFVCTICFR